MRTPSLGGCSLGQAVFTYDDAHPDAIMIDFYASGHLPVHHQFDSGFLLLAQYANQSGQAHFTRTSPHSNEAITRGLAAGIVVLAFGEGAARHHLFVRVRDLVPFLQHIELFYLSWEPRQEYPA